MKKSTVRIFAMVLAALMVLSLLPLAYAHAEETEIPVGTEIPGFIWVGDQLMEDGHRYGDVENEDFLVNPEEPGDCVTPPVYWKSCINVNPYSGESCGVTAQADWNQAMERLKTELAQRRANGEKADFESIFVNAIAELDAKYKFTGEAKGHTWVEVEYQPATCEQAGWETFHYCADCGEKSGYVELPPTGHRFVDGVCEICGIDDPDYVPPTEIEEEETQNDASYEDVEPADVVNEVEENPGVNEDNAEAAPVEGGEDEQEAVEQAADEQTNNDQPEDEPEQTNDDQPEDEPEQTSNDQPEDEPEQTNNDQPEDEPEQTNDDQPEDEPEQTNDEQPKDEQPKDEQPNGEQPKDETNNESALPTREEIRENMQMTVGETDPAIVDNFKESMEDLGLDAETTAILNVMDVTPLHKDDNTKLSDEELKIVGGIDFVMPLPEGYDPNGAPLEVYHFNEKTGEWERMEIEVDLENNRVIVKNAKSFSPFAMIRKGEADPFVLNRKRLNTIVITQGDMPVFHAPNTELTVEEATEETVNAFKSFLGESYKDAPIAVYEVTAPTTIPDEGCEFSLTLPTAVADMKRVHVYHSNGTSWEEIPAANLTLDVDAVKVSAQKDFSPFGVLVVPITVTFHSNGSGEEDKTQTVNDSDAKLDKNTFEWADHEFIGWNTKTDGTGTAYKDEDSNFPKDADFELYAQWEKKYTITFDGSGGSTDKGETTATQTILESEFTAAGENGVALDANTFKYEGYVFTGWCTDDSNVPTIKDKGPVNADAFTSQKLALYACWTEKVTVTFDPNYDTKIKPRTQDVPKDVETALNTKAYTRSGYLFVGWYDNKECTGTALESIKTSSDVTLYAKWAGPVYITGSVSGVSDDAYVGETLTANVDNAAGITDLTYQWVYWGVGKNPTTGKILTGWVNITGETGKTYVPKADKDGKRIACRVTRNGVNILTSAKTVTGTLNDVKWKQDLVDIVDGEAVSNYAQPGQIQGVTKDMEYSTNGTSWSKVTDVSDKGVVSILTPGTYKFRIAGTKIESDPIVIDRWFSLGYSTSNGTATSTTSTGTTATTSGSGTATMRSDGKAMPMQTSATSANPNVKRYAGAANMWLVREGATETITLTIRPSAGSYGHWKLNGGSYQNTGSETTVTVTPMSGPEHYIIIFNRSSASPRTADESRLGLWAALCVTSMTGAAVILTQTRKRRKNAEE